jgi:hypothetical protein
LTFRLVKLPEAIVATVTPIITLATWVSLDLAPPVAGSARGWCTSARLR